MHEYLRTTLPHEALRLALRSWAWLGVDGLVPRVSTMFGDLILEGQGGWWFLSTVDGALTRPWRTQQDCEATLATEDGLQDYLGAGLVDLAYRSELVLEDDEVIGFQVPPILGGGFDTENLRGTTFLVVHLFMAQVHAELKRPTSAPPPAPVPVPG